MGLYIYSMGHRELDRTEQPHSLTKGKQCRKTSLGAESLGLAPGPSPDLSPRQPD